MRARTTAGLLPALVGHALEQGVSVESGIALLGKANARHPTAVCPYGRGTRHWWCPLRASGGMHSLHISPWPTTQG